MKPIIFSLCFFSAYFCTAQNRITVSTADTLISYYSDSSKACNKSRVYAYVEQLPTYSKGLLELEKILNQNIKLPKTSKGIIDIWFVVNCNGLAYGFQFTKKVEGVDDQAIQKLLTENQFWKAGKQNGYIVDSCYTLLLKIKKGKLKILNDI